MRIISRRTLRDFWESHRNYTDAKVWLQDWYSEAQAAIWKSPEDIKTRYNTASFLKSNRVVFNVCGNRYRLIVKINYKFSIVYIRFVGTHADYDKVDAEVI